MRDQPTAAKLIKDPEQIRRTIAQMITDAYHRAKRRTRSKWQHARPMNWRELRDLADVDYPAYLQTDHWKSTRREANVRAGWCCENCGLDAWHMIQGESLQVHHLTYKRLGREKPRDLRVLCGECHAREHGK